MEDRQRRLDAARARSSELENHLIDELRGGRISRREFVRRGSIVGMSLPVVSLVLAACGSGETDGGGGQAAQPAQGQVRPGGLFRAGINAPSTAIDPVKAADDGSLAVVGQTGEFLVWSNSKLQLEPRLAESWKPNADAGVWRFKIRQGVKFNDGRAMTTRDVVETFDRLVDPKNASNALSAFKGVLSKGNTRAVDASTVEFRLDAANGNFPYLVSSDNYNAVVLPADYDGDFEKTFIGTGPWKLDRFNQGQSVSFVRNPLYWGPRPNPERTQLNFYDKEQALVLALQSGEVNAVAQFTPTGGKALLSDPNVQTIELKAATHRQIHMRTDRGPFEDKRVRQALALTLNRPALVDGLLEGRADLGNDSPFAPVYPSTNKTVPQRAQDIARARALLAEAGKAGGVQATLETLDVFEIPDMAQLLQGDAKQAGIDVKLRLRDSASYYGEAVFGESVWLDSEFGVTDYGHRGVPNVYLNAPLRSGGFWNSAHFRDKRYDDLVRDYTAALDVQSQQRFAGEIQTLLLDETPLIIPYFYAFLTGVRKDAGGVETTAMSHINLARAGLTA